jgi:LPXTG-motif cell wall-anchored protein
VIEGAPAAPAGGPGGVSVATVTDDQNEQVVLRADARQAGYLILDDSFYPGWEASVDGRNTPILAANENFRAVRVGPGRHTVRFLYRPVTATVGAAISVLTLAGLLLAGIATIVLRRRRAVRRGPP